MLQRMTDSAEMVRRMVAAKIKDDRLDMTDMSLKLGKNRTYIQQYITKGSPKWLPEDVRPGLARLLGVHESELRRPAPFRDGTVNQNQERNGTFSPQGVSVNTGALIEVMGMAECGPDGWSLWNGEVIDRVPRPPNLAGVPKAYAVYVVGTSMEDRYHPGELAYIHPGKPVTPGCYVLVQLQPKEDGATPRAVLKRLVKRTGNKIILAQLAPAKTFDLKADEILSMHRVVGSGEA